MKHLAILFIRGYQGILAPLKRLLTGGRGTCRYSPTCSHYAIDALQLHGFCKGTLLGALRILRCQPWGGFGLDPVPSRVLWRQMLRFRMDAGAWQEHARAIRGAVLVHQGRFVAEGTSAAAALAAALQGSRAFHGGMLYSVVKCDADTRAALREHAVSIAAASAGFHDAGPAGINGDPAGVPERHLPG